MTVETVDYRGWTRTLKVSHGILEAFVTTDVGPRIIHLGLRGEAENLLSVVKDHAGLRGGDEWRLYGGHRFWVAPHVRPATERPDNAPVAYRRDGEVLCISGVTDPDTGIRKELTISAGPGENELRVGHTLANEGVHPVRAAPWAITGMAPGGVAVMPLSTADMPDGILPNRAVVYWPFTCVTDPGIAVGERSIVVRHPLAGPDPGKIGTNGDEGWIAYLLGRRMVVKTVEHLPGAEYADRGASLQVFYCTDFVEIETLGPLELLEPGARVTHLETWRLAGGVDAGTEDELLAAVRRVVAVAETISRRSPGDERGAV